MTNLDFLLFYMSYYGKPLVPNVPCRLKVICFTCVVPHTLHLIPSTVHSTNIRSK